MGNRTTLHVLSQTKVFRWKEQHQLPVWRGKVQWWSSSNLKQTIKATLNMHRLNWDYPSCTSSGHKLQLCNISLVTVHLPRTSCANNKYGQMDCLRGV